MSLISNAENSFIKAEPVIAAHGAAAVVGYILTALVTHGVITTDQASTVTQQVVPATTALFLLALGWLVRHLVSPAAKQAERVETAVAERLGAPVVAEITAAWDAIAPPVAA
jgi:hypothetical protein